MTRPKNSPRRKILGLALLLLMASLPTRGGRAEAYETCVNGNAMTSCEPFPRETDLRPSVARLPRISLTRHDPHYRISSRLESMFREVKDIFRRVGVDAMMRCPGEHAKSAEETIALRVVLMPHLASDWGSNARTPSRVRKVIEPDER